MSFTTKLGTAVVGVLALGALAAPAPAAHATSMYSCAYPRVCLYDGAYYNEAVYFGAQMTGYQNLPSTGQNRADAVVNTRNDDSVWLLDTGASPDRYLCIPRNTAANLGSYRHPSGSTWAGKVDTIRIWSDNGLCSGGASVTSGSVPDGWRG